MPIREPGFRIRSAADPNHDGAAEPTKQVTAADAGLLSEAERTLAGRTEAFDCGRRLQKCAAGGGPGAGETGREGGGRLLAEDDEGDVEYKWRLTGISPCRFQHLVSQMQFRVTEGNGQCLYELGVADDGRLRGLTRRDYAESLATVRAMAAALRYEATVVHERVVSGGGGGDDAGTAGEELVCGEILVSRGHAVSQDVSVAFCGPVDSGKSTLMGVLLSPGLLDDGAGCMRQTLFNHKHEVDSGRTTSISTRVWPVPCDSDGDSGDESEGKREGAATGEGAELRGKEGSGSSLDSPQSSRIVLSPHPTNSPTAFFHPLPPSTGADAGGAASSAVRLVSLMDLGGEIAKCMLFGLMSRRPDYVCLCVAADGEAASLVPYAQVCCAMGTPFLVVVTRSDAVEEFELDTVLMDVYDVLESVGCRALPVDSPAEARRCGSHVLPRRAEHAAAPSDAAPREERLTVPVFCASCVSGSGIQCVHKCVAHLRRPRAAAGGCEDSAAAAAADPSAGAASSAGPPFEVLLDSFFDVRGVGAVVHGRVLHSTVDVGCRCFIGPDREGQFAAVTVRGIHIDGAHVNKAHAGDEATFALGTLPPSVDVGRKGKLLVRCPARVHRYFSAEVQVLSQTLSRHAQPILYTRNARQAVRVTSLLPGGAVAADEEQHAGAGEVAAVRCEFMYQVEVVVVGAPLVLHWNPNGIAVGKVTEVFSD